MKSDVATDLIRHVIDSIIDNISNKIVDANINTYFLRQWTCSFSKNVWKSDKSWEPGKIWKILKIWKF